MRIKENFEKYIKISIEREQLSKLSKKWHHKWATPLSHFHKNEKIKLVAF